MTTALATCAALGLTTSYIGTIGSDRNGERMRAELDRRGVDVSSAVARNAESPFAVILLDDRHGERVVLWHRDPAIALSAADVRPDAVTGARLLHVDDVDIEASLRAAAIATAAGNPVTSDIERSGDEARALVDAVTIPIFAEHVPAALTGYDDLPRALAQLRKPHHAMLCVTLGARGALLLAGDDIVSEPGIAVNTVDTTGAGDIFRGAFIYALLRGDRPREVVRFANAAAAISCTRIGAMSSIPSLADIRNWVGVR